jgi:ABC-type antimicrobial peptide transport system permease subunit
VVADEHCNDLLGPPAPCGWRAVGGTSLGFFHVRVRSGDPMRLVPAVREIAGGLSPDAAVALPMTMRARMDEITGSRRVGAAISSGLAAFALLLVGVGCVSIFLAMVNGSLREIAIRAALGAGSGRLAARIVAHGLGLTAIGVGIGVLSARWIASRLSSQLYQVSASDTATYVFVPMVVILLGLASVSVAARAAVRTDPMRHLQGT